MSLGEKYYFYDRYGQRNSYSSSLKLLVKSEISGTMFIKHRKRDFRYSMGLSSEKIWETIYELPERIEGTEEEN